MSRSGRCAFRSDPGWRALFGQLGLSLHRSRPLSRLRDVGYPVPRMLYVLG